MPRTFGPRNVHQISHLVNALCHLRLNNLFLFWLIISLHLN